MSATPVLWCDNVGAIALASNPIFHPRTKHIEVDYRFIREKILHKDLIAQFVSTVDQCADLFTKGLTLARFLFFCDKLMVTAPPMSLREAVKVKDHLQTSSDANAAALPTISEDYTAKPSSNSVAVDHPRSPDKAGDQSRNPRSLLMNCSLRSL